VILFVFLPTLIFESAFNLDPRQLRRNLLPVLTLAIPGLIISTSIIGTLVWLATPFDFPTALLLGSILSATDPVAVIAIFKNLGAPSRLTVLVEGESLFNDATAIVVSRILVGVAAGGYVFTPEAALGSIGEITLVFLGGALVGWVLALFFGWMLGAVESDPFIETSLTTILAYISFLVAEGGFHVSGVMATVAAGLTMGSWGRAKLSASVAGHIEHFWEYMAYMANALVFLFVGLRVDLMALYNSLDILVWVIVGMLFARAVVIYGLIPLVGRLPNAEPIDVGYRTVMYWGGLRGAIALAIVLSLKDFPAADLLVALVMGAVLFTLIVQGLSIGKVVKRFGLDNPPLADRVGRVEALLWAKRHGLERIPELRSGGLFSSRIATSLEHQLQQESENLHAELDRLRGTELDPVQERRLLFARTFAAEKTIYYDLFANGHLSENAYRDVCHSVDLQAETARHDRAMPTHTLHAWGEAKLDNPFFDKMRRWYGDTKLAERFRLSKNVTAYEVAWSRHQAAARLLAEFDELGLAEAVPADIVAEVRAQYEIWMDASEHRIDGWTEQFPEFVTAMQERLAKRLVVHAETEIIEREARAGSISEDVRKTVLDEFANQIHGLRGGDIAPLRVDPAELLRKVDFFKDLLPADFERIVRRLRPRTIAAGESVIREGDKGETLFLVARGVVRVSRATNGAAAEDLATLMAGDFFGEMALLHGEARTATCRAVTPSALYALMRRDFDEVRAICPAMQSALEKADRERRQETPVT
jgi:CPA1 family monovalent cation:H+ antiporter